MAAGPPCVGVEAPQCLQEVSTAAPATPGHQAWSPTARMPAIQPAGPSSSSVLEVISGTKPVSAHGGSLVVCVGVEAPQCLQEVPTAVPASPGHQ